MPLRHQCLSAERSATTAIYCYSQWVNHDVTSAFRRSGQRRPSGMHDGRKPVTRSPVPFGGAVSDDASPTRSTARSGMCVTSAFRRSGQRRRRVMAQNFCLSPSVTSAFRRSGQRRLSINGRMNVDVDCHQCLSAERSATTNALDDMLDATNGGHQCLSAERSATTSKRDIEYMKWDLVSPVPFGGAVSDDNPFPLLWGERCKRCHQCLSAERSATTGKSKRKCLAVQPSHQCLSAERSATTSGREG